MSLLKETVAIRRHAWLILIASILAIALLLAGCSQAAVTTQKPPQTILVPGTSAQLQVSPLYDENTAVFLYEQCMPGVVEVNSVIDVMPTLPSPFRLEIPKQRGQGSGFIIDDQGHILTNNHVVEKASSVRITLNDGTQLDAKVIGTDRHNDLALLQVDAAKLTNAVYLPLADSDKVKPGQMAVALGSPFGLQGSITVGVISGVGRSIAGATERHMANIIQTDAAINPGNSGGPLLNSRGEVIGINTAIEAVANGVGFAVPINTAKSMMPELLKGGPVKTAWLGIEGRAISQELAAKLKLPVEKGVYVVGIVAGSPAEKAGLVDGGRNNQNEPTSGGDIITAVDNAQVGKVEDLIAYFNAKKPGDKVNLSVLRGSEKISVTAELGEWPEQLPTSFESGPDENNFDFGPFQFRWK
jgi:S1-C subfamily serine protease